MQLTLYSTNDEAKKINKTLTFIKAYNGNIKEDCDISSPVITMMYDDDVFSANYCYINDYGRFYFIIKKVIGIGNLLTIYLECDVIYTFKPLSWYTDNLYCLRRTNGNKFLKDENISFRYNKSINISTDGITYFKEFNVSENTYQSKYKAIVSCLSDLQGRENIVPSETNTGIGYIPSLNRYSNGGIFTTMYYVLDMDQLDTFTKQIYDNDAIKTFIKSILIVPYEPDTIDIPTNPNQMRIGNTNITYTGTNQFKYLKYQNFDRFHYARIIIPNAISYLDYEPYTTLDIFLPYHKWIQIPLEQVRGMSRIDVYYYVNYDDGTSQVMIYNSANGELIYQAPCSLAIKVGISSSNQIEISNQKTQLGINSAITSIGSILSIVGGVMTENPLLIGGGVAGLVGGNLKNVVTASQLRNMGQVDIGTGNDGMISIQEIMLRYVRMIPNLTNENQYLYDVGRPFNDYISISSDDVDSDEILYIDDDNIKYESPMLKSEYDKLISLLKNGVRK